MQLFQKYYHLLDFISNNVDICGGPSPVDWYFSVGLEPISIISGIACHYLNPSG